VSAALLLGAGGIIYGYSNVGSVDIGSVSLTSINVVFENMSFRGVNMMLDAVLVNPSSNSILLSNIRYRVNLSGMELGEVKLPALTLGPASSKHLNVTLRITNEEAIRELGEAINTTRLKVKVTLSGETPVKWFGVATAFMKPVKVEKEVTVNIGKYLASMKAESASSAPLAAASPPPLEVVKSRWIGGGEIIGEVAQGVPVTAMVEVKALNDVNTHLELCIYADIGIFKDSLVVCNHKEINLKKGETAVISQKSGLMYNYFIRGYYMILGVPKSCGSGGCSSEMSYILMDQKHSAKIVVSKDPIYKFSMWWERDGKHVSSVKLGQKTYAKVKVEAPIGGWNTNFRVCVRADLTHRRDVDVKCIDKQVNFEPGDTYTFEVPFTAKYYDNIRGYFIEVRTHNPSKKWTMDDHYPPRLKLTSKNPTYKVADVVWVVNGHSVAKVVEGQDVQARVSIISSTGLYQTRVKFCVRADRAGLPDENVRCVTKTISIGPGKTYTVTIPFKAEHYARLRGYFIEVKGDNPDFSWHQESKYPPRLRYVSPSYRVDRVEWVAGGHSVTEVSKDTWVDAKITIHTDTGLANARITFCVREDRANAKDHDKACTTRTLYLSAGSSYTVTIHFKATYYKKSYWIYSVYTRGYFVEVRSGNPHYKWTMDDHYPPRLKVKG